MGDDLHAGRLSGNRNKMINIRIRAGAVGLPKVMIIIVVSFQIAIIVVILAILARIA